MQKSQTWRKMTLTGDWSREEKGRKWRTEREKKTQNEGSETMPRGWGALAGLTGDCNVKRIRAKRTGRKVRLVYLGSEVKVRFESVLVTPQMCCRCLGDLGKLFRKAGSGSERLWPSRKGMGVSAVGCPADECCTLSFCRLAATWGDITSFFLSSWVTIRSF